MLVALDVMSRSRDQAKPHLGMSESQSALDAGLYFREEYSCLCIEVDSGIMTAVYEPTLRLVGTNIDA